MINDISNKSMIQNMINDTHNVKVYIFLLLSAPVSLCVHPRTSLNRLRMRTPSSWTTICIVEKIQNIPEARFFFQFILQVNEIYYAQIINTKNRTILTCKYIYLYCVQISSSAIGIPQIFFNDIHKNCIGVTDKPNNRPPFLIF